MLTRADCELILTALEGMNASLGIDMSLVKSDLAIASIAMERSKVQTLYVLITTIANRNADTNGTSADNVVFVEYKVS